MRRGCPGVAHGDGSPPDRSSTPDAALVLGDHTAYQGLTGTPEHRARVAVPSGRLVAVRAVQRALSLCGSPGARGYRQKNGDYYGSISMYPYRLPLARVDF